MDTFEKSTVSDMQPKARWESGDQEKSLIGTFIGKRPKAQTSISPSTSYREHRGCLGDRLERTLPFLPSIFSILEYQYLKNAKQKSVVCQGCGTFSAGPRFLSWRQEAKVEPQGCGFVHSSHQRGVSKAGEDRLLSTRIYESESKSGSTDSEFGL